MTAASGLSVMHGSGDIGIENVDNKNAELPLPASTNGIAHVSSGLDEWAAYTGVPRAEWERWGVIEKGGRIAFTWSGHKFQKVRGIRDKAFEWIGKKPAGPVLWPFPIEHQEIFLCEGESDCGILRHLGFPAHTFGGVENAKGADAAEILRAWGVTACTIIFDADAPGRDGARTLRDGLIDNGIPSRILNIGGFVDRTAFENDIRDIWLRNGTQLREQLDIEYARTESDFQFQTSAEYASGAPEFVPWICEPYLARGSLTLLCGVAKGGKTTWTFALLRELRPSATGGLARNFLGSAVVPSRVFYMTEDEKSAWKVRRDSSMPDIEDDAHIYVVGKGNPLMGDSWNERIQNLERIIRDPKMAPDIVVIDTIPVWAELDDENSAPLVNQALEPLRRLAERTNVAILAIHYFNKSGSSRGSTAFEAIPNVLIDIETTDNRETRTLSIRGKLQRTDSPPITYKMVSEVGKPVRLEKVETAERVDTVLAVFRDDDNPDGISLKEIAFRADMDIQAARRKTYKLVQDGLVIRTKSENIRQPDLYRRALTIRSIHVVRDDNEDNDDAT